MTTFAKSVQLTVLDQNIFTATNRLTSGRGGLGRYVQQRAVVTTTSTDPTTLFYRMVRVPTNAFISKVWFEYENPLGGTVTTMTVNVGFWASDAPAPGDGTSAWMLDYTTAAISDSFFAYNYAAVAASLKINSDITFQNASGNSVTDGYYTNGASVYPLWDAVQNGGLNRLTVAGYSEQTQGIGYSSLSTAPWTSPANGGTVLPNAGDPGGFVDIGFRQTALSTTTGVNVMMTVDYVLG